MDFCCRKFEEAQKKGTDNEMHGRAISKFGEEFSIGTMDPIKFCPWCGRNVNMAKAVYDPNMKMPPEEVVEAAKLVENYFGENHMGDWEFMGLRNRFPKP